MKTELENTELRKVIDKAYDSGYNDAVRKAVAWLIAAWLKGDGISYELIDDFVNALKK